ncbi:hypothetical protein BJ138DRAFT_1108109 [Hygrophoropsis aurantiaca]|uniref:Uncharacterized protein n=1 Tax=Hygrophoropsis aurantiaca TaxID=72124 RepID=A0ACB7ZPV3_9AGAM|nr:hypothetical protein BJ138DRAFT_1108109 [Hygrophoropsis aurantiaca]
MSRQVLPHLRPVPCIRTKSPPRKARSICPDKNDLGGRRPHASPDKKLKIWKICPDTKRQFLILWHGPTHSLSGVLLGTASLTTKVRCSEIIRERMVVTLGESIDNGSADSVVKPECPITPPLPNLPRQGAVRPTLKNSP